MAYSLSAAERETIVRWDQVDGVAKIYTSDPITFTRLHKLGEANPNDWKKVSVETYQGKVVAENWICPKAFITFRTKAAQSHMTEEQKAAASERMKEIRKRQLMARNES